MAFEKTRFTLMAFPQGVDESRVLSLNIVFIPRNINPLEEVNTIYGTSNKAKPFVDVRPKFTVKVVNNPDEFPGKIPADEVALDPLPPLEIKDLTLMRGIYRALRDTTYVDPKDNITKPKYFDIDELRSADKIPADSRHRAPDVAQDRDMSIRKYLPESYRNAFNFTSPRVRNAVTDDSYRCALRDQKAPDKDFKQDSRVSWGKVYGYLMRQPLMAEQAGLIYRVKVQLDEHDLEKGGWIYADLKDVADSDYFQEQNNSMTTPGADPFIKRYGARIPVLKKDEARSLFAAVLFPVMKTGESPVEIYDELFIEAATYNEGFATIVHANQPVSGNLQKEEHDGFHPQKEIGIRLGWEDEQILIWYLRMLAADETTNKRLDAPLGVFGYQVDVKLSTEPDTEWESLTAVKSNGIMQLERTGDDPIQLGEYTGEPPYGELPYQVYPTKVYDKQDFVDNKNSCNNYWLPMYFANWNNTSLVLPDKKAAKLYRNHEESNYPVAVSETYQEKETTTKLEYGNEYHFRVRLSDISGGCPPPSIPTLEDFPASHIAKAKFKRYVAPNEVIIQNADEIIANTDDANFEGATLKLSRPLLGYPAVNYTGKYKTTDPYFKLEESIKALIKLQNPLDGSVKKGGQAFGIPDPDVISVEIKVEVETLGMDNLASDDGREHYITLYKTYRSFLPFDETDETRSAGNIEIPITYKHYDVLNLTDTFAPFPITADNDFIEKTDGETEIILPTARNLRVTLRAVGAEYKEKDFYWGNDKITDSNMDPRFGKKTVIHMRSECRSENDVLKDVHNPKTLQGIFLQPDHYQIKTDPVFFKAFRGGNEGMPDIMQRLGNQLDVAVKSKDLTLTSNNGERLQFWCSNLLRHSMAPDNSSITFANNQELHNHWLVCTTLIIDRDWTWDSLDTVSFKIYRKKRMGNDLTGVNYDMNHPIGDLELRRTASFQAIQKNKDGLIDRTYTRIILIDVVDGKPAEGKFPETTLLRYKIETCFKTGQGPEAFETDPILLPATVNPTQTPRLIAAGVALSPYNRNQKYSFSEARTRFLWLEFDSAPKDKRDALFCRVLANSPDQLISNNHPSLLEIPEEPPLPIDPEYIRVVTPAGSHEHSGLSAMQKMEKSPDPKRHFYLLPIPPGLHHESPELFGLFTYEFRYGHTDEVWSTAQGRFGRALRVAGLQHPAPTLNCMVSRNETEISVNAPYATAVFNGKNVTANPLHTSIWALLYAQVKQADGLDYGNILLHEMELKAAPKRNEKELFEDIRRSLEENNKIFKEKNVPVVEITNELIHQNLHQQIAWGKESAKQAFGVWKNKEVKKMLSLYGLPTDSSLSVLCVEVFGQITNAGEHMDDFMKNKGKLIEKTAAVFNKKIADAMERNIIEVEIPPASKQIDPLNSQLGFYRILRTSPLTEVPFICTS